MKAGDVIAEGVFVLVLLALGFCAGRRSVSSDPVEPLKPQVDTLFIRDTITAETPVFVTQRVVDSIPYPVYLPQYLHDTVTVYLPRTERVYEDSTYRAVVSGYEPRLDTISVYQKNSLIIRTIPVEVSRRTRWGVGVTAGYGMSKEGVSPFIGVGVSYNILSW